MAPFNAIPPEGTFTVKLKLTGVFRSKVPGVGVTENVGEDDELTVTVMFVFCVNPPPVPLIGRVYVPAVAGAVIVSVELPDPVTDVGENVPVTPEGELVPALSATVGVAPLRAVTVTVD